MRSYFILGFSLLLSIILFTRCEESEPGCLDKNAENFDVQAIDACDTCCILPQVRLDMDLMFDTLPVSLGVDYAFGADADTFNLRSIVLPFSDFTFIGPEGMWVVEDTIRNFSPTAKDDYLIIENNGRQNIGFTSFLNAIKDVDMTLGYSEARLRNLQPFIDIHPTGRVLRLTRRLYADSTDVFTQMEMEIELADSVRSLLITEIPDQKLKLTYVDGLRPQQGMAWDVPVQLDMNRLLRGVDVTAPNEVIAETIGQNLAVSVRER